MARIVLATHNPHKVEEFQAMKNAHSHRARAFRELAPFLEAL